MAPRKPTTRAGAAPAATTRRSNRLNKRAPSPAVAPNQAIPDDQHRITKTKAAPKSKAKPAKYDCTTCDRTLSTSSFPKYGITETCEHLINTCKACLKEWVTAQLEMTTYDKIACPQCPSIMKNDDVKRAAPPKVYERFDEIERRGIAETVPGWRWCMNPKCRAGQVHEPLVKNPDLAKSKVTVAQIEKEGDDDLVVVSPEAWNKVRQAARAANTIDLEAMDGERFTIAKTGKRTLRSHKSPHPKDTISTRTSTYIRTPKKLLPEFDSDTICTCKTCSSSACIPCDRPYHEGETCAQYQRRRKRQTGTEEKASESFIGKECKQCPKCKKNIEKNGGCDQVICTQCRTSFCWRCEVDYVDIRKTGHGQGCPYARQGAIDPHNMLADGFVGPPFALGGDGGVGQVVNLPAFGGGGMQIFGAIRAAILGGGGGGAGGNANDGNANR